MSGALASAAASATYSHSSTTIRRSRSNRRGIHPFLEWLHAQTTHGIEEALFRLPLLHIHIQEPRNSFGHLCLRHRRTDDRPQRSVSARRAADGDLIPLLAALIHAEDSDIADMVVAAG